MVDRKRRTESFCLIIFEWVAICSAERLQRTTKNAPKDAANHHQVFEVQSGAGTGTRPGSMARAWKKAGSK